MTNVEHRKESGPAFADPDEYARARDFLFAEGYTESGICRVLGLDALATPRANDIPQWQRKTRGGTRLDTLIRLFMTGVTVDRRIAGDALSPVGMDRWMAAGLLGEEGDQVAAKIKLLPYGGLLLAFDRPLDLVAGTRPNFVMGVGSSTKTLVNTAIRAPEGHVLDLGTGCGVLGLLAAKGCASVVGTDRNPRAIDFFRFNARLNDIRNVEGRCGDLFEPVAQEKFHGIFSNPPYVISPAGKYVYRDSGCAGDDFCRRLIGEIPAYLEEGGFAQVLCNWIHPKNGDWRARLQSWFEGSGCDAWILHSDTWDPSLYALMWIKGTESEDPRIVDRAFNEWMDYYESAGVEAISMGLVVLRRTSGRPNWFKVTRSPEKMVGPAGAAIRLRFHLLDFIQGTAQDSVLLTQRLRVSKLVRMEQTCEPGSGGWRGVGSRLKLVSGLAETANIDPLMAHLVGRCDGTRELAAIVREINERIDVDPGQFVPACLGVVRSLVELGFLLPAEWEELEAS
ncbi:MAG: methyltransferase [Planctomycetota bacterium]